MIGCVHDMLECEVIISHAAADVTERKRRVFERNLQTENRQTLNLLFFSGDKIQSLHKFSFLLKAEVSRSFEVGAKNVNTVLVAGKNRPSL